MKKMIFCFLFLAVLIFISCSHPAEDEAERTVNPNGTGVSRIEKVGGIIHVYNPSFPLKGSIELELENLLEIDSLNVEPESVVFFNRVAKSDNGNIYIGDMNAVSIFQFNGNGKLMNRFLRKGEGPGEHRYGLFLLQPLNNDIWVPGPGKIIRFSAEGRVLEEIKLQKKYRNVEIVDEDRFIGNFSIHDKNETDVSKGRKYLCALMDRKETILVRYFEDLKAGETEVIGKVDDRVLKFNFFASPITPDFLHQVSRSRPTVYFCLSSEYSIAVKNIKGELFKVIHREHQKRKLSESDRWEIVESFFSREPSHIKRMILENLPDKFCSVSSIQLLPDEFLAVYRITGIRTFEVDIFNPDGQYIYQLKLPGGKSDIPLVFHQDSVSTIDAVDDRNVYKEYRVKNGPGIFENRFKTD